jgi:uncharacterized protein GlcG (DUF336 family)
MVCLNGFLTIRSRISQLNLDLANRMIEAALKHSKELGYEPMAVVVVDESGNIKSAQREDGASMFRVDVARGKAWGAVAFGVSSRELGERAKGNPNFFVTLASTAEGKFLPQPGAVLIKGEEGTVMGAIGASGGSGDEDEAICMHGVVAAGLRHS